MKNISKRSRLLVTALVLSLVAIGVAVAEDERPKSPDGSASTQIGDAWIDITYSRPILRGRGGIFGTGEEYGKAIHR